MALILAILELYSEQAHSREHRKEVKAKKGIRIPIQLHFRALLSEHSLVIAGIEQRFRHTVSVSYP